MKVFEKPTVKTVGSALRYRRNVTDAAELRRVVDFADSNLCDRIERRKQFCQRRRSSRTDAADAVDAGREHTGFGTNNRNIAACVGLHTRLRSQRGERTGRSCRACCKRDRKIHQLAAGLRFGNIRNFRIDDRRSFSGNTYRLCLRRYGHLAVDSNGLPCQ